MKFDEWNVKRFFLSTNLLLSLSITQAALKVSEFWENHSFCENRIQIWNVWGWQRHYEISSMLDWKRVDFDSDIFLCCLAVVAKSIWPYSHNLQQQRATTVVRPAAVRKKKLKIVWVGLSEHVSMRRLIESRAVSHKKKIKHMKSEKWSTKIGNSIETSISLLLWLHELCENWVSFSSHFPPNETTKHREMWR